MKGKINLIAAIGLNNEIGYNNTLLFNNKIDKEWFKDITKNRTVVMGRKTYESIGGALPNRDNMILTTNSTLLEKNKITTHPEGFFIDSLYKLKEQIGYLNYIGEDVYIIGGESLYKEFINDANALFITKIYKSWSKADAFFPPIDMNKFKISYESKDIDDEIEECSFNFIKYVLKT